MKDNTITGCALVVATRPRDLATVTEQSASTNLLKPGRDRSEYRPRTSHDYCSIETNQTSRSAHRASLLASSLPVRETPCTTPSLLFMVKMPLWKVRKNSSSHEGGCIAPGEVHGSNSHQSAVKLPLISKPFNLMTIEELLEALPTCNTAAIKDLWLPEFYGKLAVLRTFLATRPEYSDKVVVDLSAVRMTPSDACC